MIVVGHEEGAGGHAWGRHGWYLVRPLSADSTDNDHEVWNEQVRQHLHRHLRNERPKVRLRPGHRRLTG
ncbi:hypothetical protein [Micromonospora sp. I033]